MGKPAINGERIRIKQWRPVMAKRLIFRVATPLGYTKKVKQGIELWTK